MARGFADETAEQEARGPGPSAEAVSAAEGNAIGSAMSSAMGFGPNDGSDDEDFDQSAQQDLAALATRDRSGFAMGNPSFQLGRNYDPVTEQYSSKMAMNQFLNIANTRTKNLKEARSTLGRLQGVLGPGNALTKDLYNGIMGISSKNPYGHGGVFSSFLGIDPKNIDYTQNMGIDGVAKVAQLKYDRYKDYAGQDPLSQKRGFGSLFAGPVGEVTSQGPVAQQVDINNIPIGDAIGAQAATLGLGPFGYGLMSIADPFSTYVPTGSAAYNSEFDPAVNKDLPSSVMGQAAARSGLGIESLVDKVTDFFSPEVAEPIPTSIGIAPADLRGFENRFSQSPLTGEKTAPALGTVFEVDGRSFIAGKNGPIELKGAAEQQVVSPSPLMNSFAPETELRTPTEQYARETGQLALPSSTSTDGYNYTMDAPSYLTDTSDRKAQAQNVGLVDYTNLTNTGNNLYRSTPDPDLVDKAFEFLGIRDPARRSSGQIKGSTINSTPLFNFPEFKFSDYYPF